jgi:hypothetical protein
MAQVTRSTGFGLYTTGTLRSVYQQKAIIVTIKDSSNTAVDLQSLDDGADEMVEAIVRELQPLMYYTPSASSGIIHMIVDGHAVDADTLQARVRHVAAGVQGHAAADNDSTVAVGTTFVVA